MATFSDAMVLSKVRRKIIKCTKELHLKYLTIDDA